MIEVAHVSKRYGDLTAVSDVSFTAAARQILGFLGPNGAGKTTTMRIITGFLPATSGTVKVEGFDAKGALLERYAFSDVKAVEPQATTFDPEKGL